MKGLRLIRESRGMTQSEAARMLGLSRQAYGNYEHGKRQADYDTLLRIAEILQCSVDALLGRESIAEQLLRIPDDLRMAPVLAHLTDLLIPAGQRSAVDYIPFRDPDESDAGLLYAVRMEGDSMFAKIEHGDYLLIRQQDTAESGELIALGSLEMYAEMRGLPSAQAGTWIHDGCEFKGGNDWVHCSKCGHLEVMASRSNYCPNCGADMRGDTE